MASWINKCKSYQEFEKYMKKEKCIHHPWATNEDGNCWKCEENRETLKEVADKLKDRDELFPELNERAKDIIMNIKDFGLVDTENGVIDARKVWIKAPKDDITTSVMEDLTSRADRGLQKYNTTLGENNKDDFMNHLYEELLDAAQYIKKEQSFIPTIQKLIYETSNDQELGVLIRKIYGK
jgi:hypothetical protein